MARKNNSIVSLLRLADSLDARERKQLKKERSSDYNSRFDEEARIIDRETDRYAVESWLDQAIDQA